MKNHHLQDCKFTIIVFMEILVVPSLTVVLEVVVVVVLNLQTFYAKFVSNMVTLLIYAFTIMIPLFHYINLLF